MLINNILAGTIVKCQKDLCNNKVRLTENYCGNIENFQCQICSGGLLIGPVLDKLFPADCFTSCEKCKTIFLIKEDYFGKSLKCEFCKTEIPSLQNDQNTITGKPSEQFDWSNFKYAFESCIKGDGNWEISSFLSYNEKVSLSKEQLLNIDTFEIVYYQKMYDNEEEEEIYDFIIKRKDGIFVCFSASTDGTGFDFAGGGSITYSDNWPIFYNKCLDTRARNFLL